MCENETDSFSCFRCSLPLTIATKYYALLSSLLYFCGNPKYVCGETVCFFGWQPGLFAFTRVPSWIKEWMNALWCSRSEEIPRTHVTLIDKSSHRFSILPLHTWWLCYLGGKNLNHCDFRTKGHVGGRGSWAWACNFSSTLWHFDILLCSGPSTPSISNNRLWTHRSPGLHT